MIERRANLVPATPRPESLGSTLEKNVSMRLRGDNVLWSTLVKDFFKAVDPGREAEP